MGLDGEPLGELGRRAIASAKRAREPYQSTEYLASLDILVPISHKDSAVFGLMGQNYMIRQYKER